MDSLPPERSTVVNGETAVIETRIRKYKPFLNRISSELGFNELESNIILEEVCLQAKRQYADYSGKFPFKIWLSKILVRKCIHKISTDLFNRQTNAETKTTAFGNYSATRSIYVMKQEQVPLSYWLVYLLKNVVGFTDAEIGEILNISSIQVREKLNGASPFVVNR